MLHLELEVGVLAAWHLMAVHVRGAGPQVTLKGRVQRSGTLQPHHSAAGWWLLAMAMQALHLM